MSGQRLVGTGLKDACDGVVLGGGDPQLVLGLQGGSRCPVLAADRLVWRQPRGGVTVALGAVRGTGGRAEVQRVIRDLQPLLGGKLLRAGNSRMSEGYRMIHVDSRAGVPAALELGPSARVRVVEDAGLHSGGHAIGVRDVVQLGI
jgi:hypothetical protein